jgi:hypothetical protein
MKLTHYLDKVCCKITDADAHLVNLITVSEMRNKVWWQIPRDDQGRVTLMAFKVWVSKYEPIYLRSFDVSLKLHLQCKNVLSNESELVPHFINLIFAKLCVDLSHKLLQPRHMRRELLKLVGAENLETLYPVLLEFSGLEDADIPYEGTEADPISEGMIICTDFVDELETYFCKKTDGEMGSAARELEQTLTMKASLKWFSEEQDDVDARRFVLFSGESKKGVLSEEGAEQKSAANASSSEDSDEPEPKKIKEFDLKLFSASKEMRNLIDVTKKATFPVKSLIPEGTEKTEKKVAKAVTTGEAINLNSSQENFEEGLQMKKKVEWEKALYMYSEFCLKNSCAPLRFLIQQGMTTICNGFSQQISAIGFQGMDVFFSVSYFRILICCFSVNISQFAEMALFHKYQPI